MGLPMMLHVVDKEILVIGGGKIASRKIQAFLEQGALVTCVSPDLTEELESIKGSFNYIKRVFAMTDIGDYFIVVAATDDRNTNGAIYAQCQSKGILCMTVDHDNPSDFDFMAKRMWNDLTIAVSTDGKAPAYAKSIIDKLASVINDSELQELQNKIDLRKQLFDE